MSNLRYPHDDTAIIRANRLEAQMRESLEKARCVNEIAKERDARRKMLNDLCTADAFGLADEVSWQLDRARRYLRETGGAA